MKQFDVADIQDSITEQAVRDGARTAEPGSIFIVVRGMILAHTFPVCIAKRRVAFNQDVKALFVAAQHDGRFLAHWLAGNEHRMLGLVSEATHGTKKIELPLLLGQRLACPPLPEQRAIAAVLDTIDDAIQKTEQIIAKLQQVKQGLLHDLLTRGIDDNGELRDPERHPEQFQDSPLGRIPRGWEVLPIGSVGEVRLGKQKTPDARPSPWTRPYLRVVNIFDDRLDLRDVNEMNFSPSEFNRYALRYGDVLLTEGDLASAHNVGRTAVFRDEIPHCCFQNSLLRFRVGEDDLPDFFHYAFSHLRVCGRFARATMSTTVFHLSAGRLSPLPIMRPPLEEQRLIAERLLLVDKHLHVERSSQDKQLALVRALSDDLLTGRVRTTSLPEFSA